MDAAAANAVAQEAAAKEAIDAMRRALSTTDKQAQELEGVWNELAPTVVGD